MTKGEFYQSFLRLSKRFDDNGKHYPPEVMGLIFNEVQNMSLEWFDKLVTKLIASERLAPLLPMFRDQTKIERHKLRAGPPAGPVGFHNSIFTSEEIKEIVDVGRSVAKGLLSGALAEDYVDQIRRNAEMRYQK